jgi:hypothetical protein
MGDGAQQDEAPPPPHAARSRASVVFCVFVFRPTRLLVPVLSASYFCVWFLLLLRILRFFFFVFFFSSSSSQQLQVRNLPAVAVLTADPSLNPYTHKASRDLIGFEGNARASSLAKFVLSKVPQCSNVTWLWTKEEDFFFLKKADPPVLIWACLEFEEVRAGECRATKGQTAHALRRVCRFVT